MEEEKVTISKTEYRQLVKAEEILDALEDAGVDNWEGFSHAMDLFRVRWGEHELNN